MEPSSAWTERRRNRRVITVEEFKPLLASQAQDFLKLANGLLELNPEQWNQRQLYHLYQSTTDLETFLDDYAARENRVFFPVRELVAVGRWLAVAMSSLVHLDARLPQYATGSSKWTEEVLGKRVRESALSLGEMILRTLGALRETWERVGMAWPDGVLRMDSLSAAGDMVRLPRDKGEAGSDGEDHSSDAAQVVSRFLRLVKHMERTEPTRVKELEQLQRIVAMHCTEAQSRRFEARLHNLQSTYDSLVAATGEEEKHPALRSVRAAASVAFHLFESVTALVHLYERHRLDDREGPDGEPLIALPRFLDIVVNQCVMTAYEVLTRAAPAAQALLDELSQRCSKELRLPDGVSLHARPITLIVSIVNHHQASAEAEIEGERCSAASIMQLLVLAGSHPSVKNIRFYGPPDVLSDLAGLFEADLGEKGLDRLPERLAYLARG
jgi:phosphotransferase system HPr-like phosphotransfer protein